MVQYAPLKNFYIVVHMDSEKFQIFRLQFHTVQTMWVFLLVPKGEHVKPSKSLPTFRLYVSSIWTTDLGLHGSDSEPWWAVGTTNRCLRPSLRCAIWLAVNKRGTFLKVTSSCFFDQLKLLKLSFCSFVFWCVCVCFFLGGSWFKSWFWWYRRYIYIYISIQTGFEQWGCQSDIDCGFYSYMYISTWLNLLYIVTWFCYQHLHAQFFMCWGCPQSLPKESSLVHSDSEAFGNLSTLRGREGTQPLDALPLRRCLDQDRLVKVAWRFN